MMFKGHYRGLNTKLCKKGSNIPKFHPSDQPIMFSGIGGLIVTQGNW